MHVVVVRADCFKERGEVQVRLFTDGGFAVEEDSVVPGDEWFVLVEGEAYVSVPCNGERIAGVDVFCVSYPGGYAVVVFASANKPGVSGGLPRWSVNRSATLNRRVSGSPSSSSRVFSSRARWQISLMLRSMYSQSGSPFSKAGRVMAFPLSAFMLTGLR